MQFKKIKYGNEDFEKGKKKQKDQPVVDKDNFLTTLCNRLGQSNAVLFHLTHDKYTSNQAQTQQGIASDLNVHRWEEVSTSKREANVSDQYLDLKTTIKNEQLSATEFLVLLNNMSNEVVEEI